MTALADWPPAPLPPDELDRVVLPFGESSMLPAAAYTAPEVLAWERRHLFAGTWNCLGRSTSSSPRARPSWASWSGPYPSC